MSRNRAAWLSIADFLTHENLRAVLKARGDAAAGKRSAGAAAAPAAINFGGCASAQTSHAVPVGNTGTTSPQGAA